MKIKNLFYVSLAALSLAACSKDDAPVPEAGITFKLTSTGSMTKAVNAASVAEEAIIQNATVYLYETTSGKLVKTTAPVNSESGTVNVSAPAGKYSVAAVANYAPSLEASLNDLNADPVALSANTKSKFVMFGEAKEISVTAGESLTVAEPIAVYRLVSAIQLGTITFDIPSSADEFYVTAQKNGKIKIKSMMLESSVGSVQLGGGSVNGASDVAGKANAFLNATMEDHPVITTSNEKKAIVVTADNAEGVIAERVYGYPGTKPKLSLVVAYGEGNNAKDRYYTIDLSNHEGLSNGLGANVLYSINATINATGSDEGGSDKKNAIVNLSVASQDWTTGQVINGGSVGN